jgi:hypothetical protein
MALITIMRCERDAICGQVQLVPQHDRGRAERRLAAQLRSMSLQRFRSQQFVEQEGQSHASSAQLQRSVLLR